MQLLKNFPNGKMKAVTFSYDDGVKQDRRLVELFDRYGLKATFNLNSGIQTEQNCWVDRGAEVKRMNQADIGTLYQNHEIAVHTLTHPHLEQLSVGEILYEIKTDRQNLERLFHRSVTGMAYPFGTYNQTVLNAMKDAGIVYSRTTKDTLNFALPQKLLEWDPTCHHKHPDVLNIVDRFLALDAQSPALLYIWGHSYEFDVERNWELIETICQKLAGNDAIWYATNGEIAALCK